MLIERRACGVADLQDGATQSDEIGITPEPGRTEIRSIKIDERPRTCRVEEQVVRIEIRVVQSHVMKAREGVTDRAPVDRVRRRTQTGGKRAYRFEAHRDQIPSTGQSLRLVPRRDHRCDRQAESLQALRHAELPKGSRSRFTEIEVSIGSERGDEPTPSIMAQRTLLSTRVEENRAAATRRLAP